MPAIARNVSSMIVAVPARRPSIPSVRFEPLTVPAMSTKRNGVVAVRELEVPAGDGDVDRRVEGRRSRWSRIAATTVTAAMKTIFQRPGSPSEWRRRTFR